MSLAAQAWQQLKDWHLLADFGWGWRCWTEPCAAELLVRWGDR